jgi:hypothetical protein
MKLSSAMRKQLAFLPALWNSQILFCIWSLLLRRRLALDFEVRLNNIEISTAILWVIMQREVAITYRRFGTTYRPHLQGSLNFTLENGTDRLSRVVGKE